MARGVYLKSMVRVFVIHWHKFFKCYLLIRFNLSIILEGKNTTDFEKG